MTPRDIYKLFETKLNKNSTNSNIKVPLGVFVILWNEQKRTWLNQKLRIKESTSSIDDLEELLEVDVPLELLVSNSEKDTFKLPDNFFKRVSSYSIATKGDCKNKKIVNWVYKPKDVEVILSNSNFNPNFEWEETVAVLAGNNLQVYKIDFKIKKVYLTYYKEPKDLDISGYIRSDGTSSIDVEVDLSKENIEEITNRTVLEVSFNYENAEQAGLAAQRIKNNEQ